MGKTQKRKAKRAQRKEVYKCEICNGVEEDQPVVACDVCDKWHHFTCVGIKSIGTKDSWKCRKCSQTEVTRTLPLEKSTTKVVPSENENSTLQSGNPPKAIIKPSEAITGQNYDLRYDPQHPYYMEQSNDQFSRTYNVIRPNNPESSSSHYRQDGQSQIPVSNSSRISRISSMTNRRQKFRLEMIEEERILQEKRDQRYLNQKYLVLIESQGSANRTDISCASSTTRSAYTEDWIDRHRDQPITSRRKENMDRQEADMFENEAFLRRVNEINFDTTSPKSKKLDQRDDIGEPIQSKRGYHYPMNSQVKSTNAITIGEQSTPIRANYIQTTEKPLNQFVPKFIPPKQENITRSEPYDKIDGEEPYVACYLCTKRLNCAYMDIISIDEEDFWICPECKEPKVATIATKPYFPIPFEPLNLVSKIKSTNQLKQPEMPKYENVSAILNKENISYIHPNQTKSTVYEKLENRIGSTRQCEGCHQVDDKQPLVACDVCDKWYHYGCMNLTSMDKSVMWVCPKCKDTEIKSNKENQNTNQSSTLFVHHNEKVQPINKFETSIQDRIPLQSETSLENVNQPLPGAGHSLTSTQIASRHVVTRDLPIFAGKPEQWPMFLSRFKNSTELCGFSDSENLDRLQKCLKGNALEAVRSRLLNAESVPDIIGTLEMLYGRPELIVNSLMKKIRSEAPPRADKLNTLVDFALSVRNVCATLEQANLTYHLSNPALVQELVEKLPNNIKIDWARHKANIANVTLSTLGEFLYNLAKVISTVTEPSAPREEKPKEQKPKEQNFEKQNTKKGWQDNPTKKEYVNTHSVDKSSVNSTNSSSSCKICQKNCEKVEVCPLFKSYTVDQRWKDLFKQKLCRRCLRRHGRFCNSSKDCGVNGCTFKHHPLLHDDKKPSKEISSDNQHKIVRADNNAHSTFDRNVLLRIVPVILHQKERNIRTFAYLDDGSDITLVSKNIAEILGLQGSTQPLCLFWTGDVHRREKGSQLVHMEISGQNEYSKRYSLHGVRTVDTLGLPTQSLIKDQLLRKFPYLQGVPIIDYIDAVPEILIGSDNASLNTQLNLVEGEINQPVASECRLGWSINGRIDNKYRKNSVTVGHHRNLCLHGPADENLHQQVKDYFTVENFGVQVKSDLNLCSKEDERALELLKKFTKRINGNYETSLLWRYDSFEFPKSYHMAMKRLLCLEKHKPNLISSINDIINDYINKGYVTKLTTTEIQQENSRIWYLPIFVVKYPKKPNKIRLVFDAAAKVNGVSLNTLLLKGPDQLASLLDILRRFREKAIAITGDIKEMYHQVKIRDEDKQAQRFLWRNGESRDPDIYVMNVMTFGATCSPSAAQFVKNLNADEFQQECPRAMEAIVKNHYVDDMLECEHTEEQMIRLVKDVKRIHKNGGFEIRNFLSNSIAVMREFGNNNCDADKNLSLDLLLGTERVLGMWWNTRTDCFTFSLKYTTIKEDILNGKEMPTKRELLRTLMSIFDPLGLISHYLVHLKIILQDVWRSGMDWDDKISSEDMKMAWTKWIEILPSVQELQIPRLYSTKMSPGVSKSIELHTFVDASAQAFSAVTYVRVEDEDGVHCALIGSKTRVAPLKYLSIPRLELQGGILGTRLLASIGAGQTFKVNRRQIWTDSETLLSWIRSDHRKYHQFVAHRIGEIMESTNMHEWRWVPSKHNVADEATKWSKTISFNSTSRWYNGPEFLTLSEDNWPKNRMDIKADSTEEMKVHFVHSELIAPAFINSENFSNWNKMVRVMAYVRRYVLILRAKLHKDVVVQSPLDRDELIAARNLIFKQAQFESFPEEMVILSRNQSHPNNPQREISKRSPIFNCSPYIDENGILRIRGRIDMAPGVSKDTKRPIILPRNNRITRLLVMCYHKMYHHRNTGTVINEIGQKYHIFRLREVLKSVKFNDCQLCKVRNARPEIPEMGDLPAARLAIGFRPFTHIGIDYFGPMVVVVGRRTEKRWGVLITCLTIRAIHIEISHTLNTDSCIMCIRNFINNKGPVQEIHSDQGTNFKGMDNELNRLIAAIDVGKMATEFTSCYTKWCFNPPLSQWMGGSWERLIRSVKTSLYEIMPTRNPNDEMLRNLLMEIQNVVNSRPLTFISLDHEDDEALTPNHFLLGSSSGLKPMVPLETDGPILRSKWKENQRLTDLFWKRFVKEYLPTLTRRTKWFHQVEPIKAGDIVLLIEDTNLRNTYPRARVLEVVVGSNNQVRKARIQLGDEKRTILWRPAQLLARLDVHRNQSDGLEANPLSVQTEGSVVNGSSDLASGLEVNKKLPDQ